jgi:hypothetical protein
MEGRRKKGKSLKRWSEELDLNIMLIKQAESDQRPSGMGEDCIGMESPKRPVVLDT